MKPILLVFWNLCLLRRGPELVPTHPLFIVTVIGADALLSLFVSMRYGGEATLLQVATSISVTMATLACATWIALQLRHLSNRYAATITAIFGCDLLFTILVALLVPLFGGVASQISIGVASVIGFWSIAVNGFILHRAMNITVYAGILLAFGIALVGFALASAAAQP